MKNVKSFTEMSKMQKAIILAVLAIVLSLLIYMYLCVLQSSLKSYPVAISWLTDIMAHPEKLNSIPYMVYGFYSVSFILGFPIVFLVSTVACILFSPRWKEKQFGMAFFFPAMFIFGVIGLSCIGHIFT